MRIIAVIAIWSLMLSDASAGIIISDIYVESGIFSREYNTWWIGAPAYGGTEWGIPAGAGTSSVNEKFLENTSSVSFDFQQHGPNEIVDFAWDHSIAGLTDDEAYGYAWVVFTPDADLRYELSGLYAANGNAASLQYTELYDNGSGVSLFSSTKESRTTPNETLFVGSPLGGDFRNRVKGSLTGELMAGQFYTVFSIWYLHAYSDDAPSQATGNLRLSLSPLNSTAVPEPSSLLLVGIGACGLFAHSRRKQRRHPFCLRSPEPR